MESCRSPLQIKLDLHEMASSREPGLFTAFRDSLVTKQVVSSTMGAAPAPIAEHPTPNRWRPSLVLQVI